MTPNLTPRLAVATATLALCACAGPAAVSAPGAARLQPCPPAPHCVSSEATDERHAVRGLALTPPAPAAWAKVVQAVRAMDRTTVVHADDRYLHAEIVSPWRFYTDDLELLLDPANGQVQVRSSSRIGYYDFDVNRDRVEALRRRLAAEQVLR